MTTRRALILLLCLDIIVMLAAAFVFGVKWVDTSDYIGQIENYRHFTFSSASAWTEFRDFKPLYGALGMALPFLSPVAVILGANALFFIGLSILLFFFFEELGFGREQSLLGTAWIIAGYCGVNFGFSGGTDVSGWFFCLASAVAVLRAMRLRHDRYLVLASLLGFLGATAKETGVLGLLFGGVYLLLHLRQWGGYETFKKLMLLSVPFLVLEVALLGFFTLSGVPTIFQWVTTNNGLYENMHTLKFFLGAEFATFNALWLFIAAGLWALIFKEITLPKERWFQLIALFVAALPVIEWPFFTDRILYVEFVILVPLALLGVEYLERFPQRAWARWGLYALPVLGGLFFLIIGGHDGLYALLHQFHLGNYAGSPARL